MIQEGGFAMSNSQGDAMPENVDQLLAGGEPNQERIPLEDPQPTDFKNAAEVDPKAVAEAPPVTPGVDPIVAKLHQALSQLTPEQRASLIPQQPAEITFNGQKMSIPPDKQIPLMQQGLNYSEKMRVLNSDKQQFETAKAEVANEIKHYKAIEDTIKSNPQWWQHVQAEYQKFSANNGTTFNGSPSDAAMTPEHRAVLSKVSAFEQKLDGYLNKQNEEATQKLHQAQDAELNQQQLAVQKEYPEFDWVLADANGLTLVDRIVAHANKSEIFNFRAAARDFLYDDLIQRREFKAKEAVSKTIQSKTKAGVVTAKGKPSGLRAPKDLKRSYEDLMREGLAELG